jgi:succinate dehydrogenase cytochrome b556 subunit
MVTAGQSDLPGERGSGQDRTVEPFGKIGPWGWIGLYASGTFLLFFLLGHVWVIHFATPEPLSMRTTVTALRSPFIRFVELGLLSLAAIHVMLGLRRIVLDLEILKKAGSRYLSWVLTAAALFLIAWGFIIFGRLSAG